jgi:hypothetical protein
VAYLPSQAAVRVINQLLKFLRQVTDRAAVPQFIVGVDPLMVVHDHPELVNLKNAKIFE